MLKTTIWISRDKGRGVINLYFWQTRPPFEDGVYDDASVDIAGCTIAAARKHFGIPIPAPGELLRVEVSAEVVETIKGD